MNFLKKAQSQKYAIGGFNITSLESALAIIEAAEAEKSPVILQISDKTIDYMSLEVVFALSKALADKASVPVAIHFDHGRHEELLRQSVKIGFSSIMYDMSKVDRKDIVKIGKEFVSFAHKYGVTVELEQDSIGGKEDFIHGDICYSNPQKSQSFVEETGCDAFAVSIGNVHGKPQPGEKLDMELLSKIRQKVSVPLVLHGASSTPNELIREAIDRGICKINIDTDLRSAFNKTITEVAGSEKLVDPREKLEVIKKQIMEVVREKIRLFGSNGKA